MIDLHTHSSASDGALTPTGLVELAAQIGLSALALTDHDTVAGVPEARSAARGKDLTFIPGIEISSRLDRGSLHVVGLHVDWEDVALGHALTELVEMRNDRNRRMAGRLAALGMRIDLEEVADLAGGDVIGRPHFAELMVQKGYVKRYKAAFKGYLERGRPAYEPRQKLSPERTIQVILGAGGVPILAHPDQTHHKGEDLDRLVRDLSDMGLAGIEVYCSNYTAGQTQQYIRLARKYGLVLSGGSDFHGAAKSGILLGKGPGSLRVPDDLVAPIAERAGRIKRSNRRERVGIEPT